MGVNVKGSRGEVWSVSERGGRSLGEVEVVEGREGKRWNCAETRDL